MGFNRIINIFGKFFLPKVKDIMVRSLTTLDANASLSDALQALAEDNIRSVVIMAKGKPVGILTRRDLITLCFIKKMDAEKTTVEEVMSQPLVTIDSNENIAKAYEIMMQSHIGKLIVVEQGKPTGRIRLDEIRHLASETPGITAYRVGYFLMGVLVTIAVILMIIAL